MELHAQVISYEEYHPFGTTAYQAKNSDIKSAAKRYRYTGMERDEETGLEYHSARYYLPWLGRWMSADPIPLEDGINVYSYSRLNPIKLIDQNGKQSTVTVSDPQFNLQLPWRFRASVTEDRTRLDFFGRAEILRNEHILADRLPRISSNTGSLFLNSASISLSHHNYSLRLEASFSMTESFLEPKSWPTDLNTAISINPVFAQREGQYRFFDVNARASTTFLSVNVNARVQARTAPTVGNLLGAGVNLVTNLSQWSESLKNFATGTLGANISFNASLRFLGVPIAYALGNTNIFNRTNIHAFGLTLAPAGTLFFLSFRTAYWSDDLQRLGK